MQSARARRWLLFGAVLAVGVAAAAWGARLQQQRELQQHARALTQGDPEMGRRLIVESGCGACHLIPGIAGARGQVGPPLESFALRTYVAGMLPNTAEHLQQWLRDPPAIDEQTAMPNVGLDAQEARDVAAYLYTLD